MSESPAAPDPDNGEEKLTPEARQIIFKARRSFGLSLAILLLGFIAIVMALVYRSVRDTSGPDSAYAAPSISVPAGAEIVSVVPSAGMFAVTIKKDGAVTVELLDGKTGKLIRRIGVISE